LKTTTAVHYLGHGESALPGLTLNRSLFETILRELLLNGTEHLIELYEETSRQGWRLSRTASPGKLDAFEEELNRSDELFDTPAVAAVKIKIQMEQRHVGFAYFNPSTRHFGACEFVDDDQLCILEATISQLGIKECVLQLEAVETPMGRRLRDLVRRCGALPTHRKKSDFDMHNLEHDLSCLLSNEEYTSALSLVKAPPRTVSVEQHRVILKKELAAASLAAVIRFSDLFAETIYRGRCTMAMHDIGKYVRLDSSALSALNVLPERRFLASSASNSAPDATSNFSLYGLLNRCRCPMGKRMLFRWLKQPLVDAAEIGRRHDVVQALVENPEVRDTLRGTHLRALPDINRITRRIECRRANLADLCKLYQASTALPHIAGALNLIDTSHGNALKARYSDELIKLSDNNHLGKFEALVEAAIDMNRIPDEYVIGATYDIELENLQKRKDAINDELQTAFLDAAEDLRVQAGKVLKLESNNIHGWYLRLTKKDETVVRKQLSASYQILEAKKDGTKFTNKRIHSLSSKRMELDRAYESHQRLIVDRVVDVAASFVDIFLQISTLCAEIDVLASFAEVAVSAPIPFIRPTIHPKRANPEDERDAIMLKDSRHPCMELQQGVQFVSNTCTLVRGKSWFQVITGPNMGGKSTFIRQVGICVMMAQVGSFVPCAEAKITVRDAIFARVGAGDCQIRGISTFMAEMLETAAIIKAATPSSLIIIDELGRGTSTYDGFGLAWAISEYIMRNVKAPCLFATHFHELTALQGPLGVANYHVDARMDEESGKLTMLHCISPGTCDQSFGIECAEYAKFPLQIVKKAREKAFELEDFSGRATAVPVFDMVYSNKASQIGMKRMPDYRLRKTLGRNFAERTLTAKLFLDNFCAVQLDPLSKDGIIHNMKRIKRELVAKE
jgi:DNA mismatch repair protein MSH2|tara:strand:+ start:486 stop:3203 length:2718 start_codon:yes stop_codon:yes gene_type:complete